MVGLLGRARTIVQQQMLAPESRMLQDLTDTNYESVGSYSLMYQDPCNVGNGHLNEADAWFQLIQQECAARF